MGRSTSTIPHWVRTALPWAVVCFLGYMVIYRIPDIEKRQDRLESQLRGGMDRLSSDLRGQLTSMTTSTTTQFRELKNSVTNLKANVLALCSEQMQPLTKVCDPKALVAQVNSIVRAHANLIAAASMQLTAGSQQPIVASDSLKRQLPELTWDKSGTTTYYGGHTSAARPNIANALLWSTAAKDAYWYQDGKSLKVNFANGSGTFELKPSSAGHMDELVDSLNTTAEVLKAAQKNKHSATK